LIGNKKKINILQVLPSLESGGVERGTIEIANYLRSRAQNSFVISNGGRMVTELKKNGSVHLKLPIGKKNPFTLLLIPIIIYFIYKNKINIIHARSRMPAWLIFLTIKLIPKKIRPYFVTTVHGYNSISLYSKIMTMGDKVIVVSNFIKNFIIKNYNVDPKKIYLIHRGVPRNLKKTMKIDFDMWRILFEKNYPIIKNKKILTISARVSRTKGIDFFIDLISNLRKAEINIHGLIVGETKSASYLKKINRQIEDLDLKKNISILGYRYDIYNIIQYSDITYCLSIVPEPFGRGVIESIKLGTPVLGFDHGGCGEQLTEIFPAGKVKYKNLNELILKTRIFLEKKPKISKINKFDLESMQKKTFKLYESFYK
jgi:glycosyltransferase involved in cell wall biosynthesis